MKAAVPPVTIETPAFRDIHISNVICKGSGRAMFFNGLPEMPIQNVTVKNVTISDAKEGIVISQTQGVTLENVRIETKGDVLQIKNVNDVDFIRSYQLYIEVDIYKSRFYISLTFFLEFLCDFFAIFF